MENGKDIEAIPLNETEKRHDSAELKAEDFELPEEEEDIGTSYDHDRLPAPSTSGTSQPTQKPPKYSAYIIVPLWIILSTGVIIYNKYIYDNLKFPYPVFLVTWHLTFSAIGTRVLQRTTHLLDGVNDVKMTKDMFLRSILPIGILFSGSLILSNMAYLYLSVAFIQMLKAFNPVAILLISAAFRLQELNQRLVGIVFMISGGVSLASYGELHFNLVGFIVQALAVVFESSRLVMIQILLHGLKMDPLVSLHYYAPVCAVINLLVLPFTDGLAPFRAIMELGPLVLLTNALNAFLLNIAAVFLINATNGLVLTLTGVFKDIMLIVGSVLLFHTAIQPLQILGYSIALGGLILYKTVGSK